MFAVCLSMTLFFHYFNFYDLESKKLDSFFCISPDDQEKKYVKQTKSHGTMPLTITGKLVVCCCVALLANGNRLRQRLPGCLRHGLDGKELGAGSAGPRSAGREVPTLYVGH